jgi:hypothetical protein
MRPAALAALLALPAAACGQQENFEQRYARTSAQLDAIAAQMDAERANRAALANDLANASMTQQGAPNRAGPP